MAIKITELSKSNYTIYNGLYSGQTLYVIFDNEKLYARYGLESEPASLNIISNNSFVWEINALLTIQSVNQLMADILPYVVKLANFMTNEWDGFKWVGKFTDEEIANETLEHIQEFIDVDNEELPHYNIITPEYYSVIFKNMTPADIRSFISSKKYLDHNILFEKDPYDFVNFAIGMNANTADEYIGAIYEVFEQYSLFAESLDDTEINNNQNASLLSTSYNDAIEYYFNAIAEPDKICYLDMITYGNSYFKTCVSIFDGDDMLNSPELSELCQQYIVDTSIYEEIGDKTDDLDESDEDSDDISENTDESGDNFESELSPEENNDENIGENDQSNEKTQQNVPGSALDMFYPSEKAENAGVIVNESSLETESAGTPDEDSFWKRENSAKAI